MLKFTHGPKRSTLITKILKLWAEKFNLSKSDLNYWKWVLNLPTTSMTSLKRAAGMWKNRNLSPLLLAIEIAEGQVSNLDEVTDVKPFPGTEWQIAIGSNKGNVWRRAVEVVVDEVKFKKALKSRLAAQRRKLDNCLKISGKNNAKVMNLDYYSHRFGGGNGMGFGFKWNIVPRPQRTDYTDDHGGKLLFDEALAQYNEHEFSDQALPSITTPVYHADGRFSHDQLHYLNTSGRPEYKETEVVQFDNDFDYDYAPSTKHIPVIVPEDMKVQRINLMPYGKGRVKAIESDTLLPTFVDQKGRCQAYLPSSESFDLNTDEGIEAYIKAHPVSTLNWHQPKNRVQHSVDSLNEKALCGWAAEIGASKNAFQPLDDQYDSAGGDFCSEDPADIIEQLESSTDYRAWSQS